LGVRSDFKSKERIFKSKEHSLKAYKFNNFFEINFFRKYVKFSTAFTYVSTTFRRIIESNNKLYNSVEDTSDTTMGRCIQAIERLALTI